MEKTESQNNNKNTVLIITVILVIVGISIFGFLQWKEYEKSEAFKSCAIFAIGPTRFAREYELKDCMMLKGYEYQVQLPNK